MEGKGERCVSPTYLYRDIILTCVAENSGQHTEDKLPWPRAYSENMQYVQTSPVI